MSLPKYYFKMVLDQARVMAIAKQRRFVVAENDNGIAVVTLTGAGFRRVFAACYPDGRVIVDATRAVA